MAGYGVTHGLTPMEERSREHCVLDSGDVGHECGHPPDGGWNVPANATIREHIHYRIVFDVVGEPLSSFKSTHNLVSCVRDAFEAHHIAYTVAKVDHRDISVGNILAVEKQGNYHGLLIDWELARFQGDQISRAYERTGTRQFMAARLFDNPAPTRNVGDGIESFVLLLFWIAVQYAPNNSSEKQRTSFLNQFEDPEAKRNLILGYRQSAQRLQLESSQFRTFLVHIALQYTYRYDQPISLDDRAEVEELAAKQLALEKHDWLLDIFRTDLNDEAWKAIKDPARDNAIERVEAVKKRKADAGTEYAVVDKNKRRRGGERGPEVVDNAKEVCDSPPLRDRSGFDASRRGRGSQIEATTEMVKDRFRKRTLAAPGSVDNNRHCSCTEYDSSMNESTKTPNSSAALSIFSACSPMIQMSEALTSGPSSSSRLAHNVGITLSLQLKEKNIQISALRPFLKPGWTAVDTSNSADPNPNVFMGHSIKPDISIYSDQPASNNNLCRASDMESFLEVKALRMYEPFGNAVDELEKSSGYARDTRGQLATYFAAMHAAQHRTHSFGVIVVDDTCRLLRHTRSGTTITESFRYTDTTHLQTFFWRLSHAEAKERGTDMTFTRVAAGGLEGVPAILKAQNDPIYRVTVGPHEYFVPEAFTRDHLYPVGRGTRCFVAVRSDTLQQIVFDVVGEPLSSFESTHNLVEHSDISIGNILAVKIAGIYHGLLIDWELARFEEDQISIAYERTGTRQFLAARLFHKSLPTRNVGDDIESFVLLLFWIAVRYAPNQACEDERTSFLNQFDDPRSKKNLIIGYRQNAQDLQLETPQFLVFLAKIGRGYVDRYEVPDSLDDEAEAEELATKQLVLERHDWLLDIFKTALNNEVWKATKDAARVRCPLFRIALTGGDLCFLRSLLSLSQSYLEYHLSALSKVLIVS
ncbi:hypothetical protein B0H14DRAFT_2570106 [Mycena olivaceomarginata]|nr:hypothetical protein B0H14DRAFT_2570106 [Mycena olivaceomarginata]